MTVETLREQIELALQQRSPLVALDHLRKLWRLNPASSTAAYILKCRESLGSEAWPRRTCRVAILRSFTVEPAVPLLCAGAFLQGVHVHAQVGDFNTYAQDILDPASAVYANNPEVVILAVQTRDLVPQLWSGFSDLRPEDVRGLVENVLEQIRSWLTAFRKYSTAHLIVHNLEKPPIPVRGILDQQSAGGQVETIEELNRGIRAAARSFSNVYTLDYDGLSSRFGREQWHDPLKWILARMPVSNGCLQHLAREWQRFIYAIAGPVRKVLVTDLDNTLWGGLAGEDGLSGIELGTQQRGAGYVHLQRALLDLQRRGILLAINSKNNEADAMRILEKHAGMILRPNDFAAMRINWQDKAQNLREIAAELNVGTDSLVFLDDNPVEREHVRSALPEVEVIELPADPMKYEAAVRDSVVFERLAITAEDLVRTDQYRQQRGRLELERAATSLEEFYRSLKQVVTIAPVNAETLVRVAQLTRKTNQFNLTTRRYTEQQLQDLVNQPEWKLYSVHVEDRLGDNGLAGVVITRTAGLVCEIDTLLLSCRMIGRTVETAILAYVAAASRQAGLAELRGRFIPTPKNSPAAPFFRNHGFVQYATEGEETCWVLDLAQANLACPAWIVLQTAERELIDYAVR